MENSGTIWDSKLEDHRKLLNTLPITAQYEVNYKPPRFGSPPTTIYCTTIREATHEIRDSTELRMLLCGETSIRLRDINYIKVVSSGHALRPGDRGLSYKY